ncbi:uncharacterized protein LOC112084468 [Eutrema salsugineum]|uniref:uncharacterized protein LOC112084468 n=1 Tax=Eutrema salsugineum TaxID=72664 RepID=UPI000CED40C3|nr:uncharacterized protein LOC112084468 [Eutrema salsugineum]
MNVLSLILNKGASEGIFNYHPECEDLQLTHLSFADDLLIFLEGSVQNVAGVLSILRKFEELSGLGVNISKTQMFASGVPEEDLSEIQDRFDLTPSSLPIRYLGLPLCSRKLSVADCDPLLAQRVLKQINTLVAAFFWHGSFISAKGEKVSWDSISYPKSEGGLGMRKMSSWSDTCGLKLIWMLFFRAGSMWVAWIRAKYLSHSPFWALNEENYSFSWMFRRLLKLRGKASSLIQIFIGNGDDTFFWWDPWTPFGPLIQFMGDDGPSRLGIPLFSTVGQQISSQGWNLPNARSEKQLQLYSFLSSIVPSASCDSPVWMINGEVQKSFSARYVWNSIRERKEEVPWFKLVWPKVRIPKHAFSAWLFVLDRNPTLDRLRRWGCDVEHLCLLCGVGNESRDHLFFYCPYSMIVWKLVVSKIQVFPPPSA